MFAAETGAFIQRYRIARSTKIWLLIWTDDFAIRSYDRKRLRDYVHSFLEPPFPFWSVFSMIKTKDNLRKTIARLQDTPRWRKLNV